MTQHFDVPPELLSLIEKRESPDRRKKDQPSCPFPAENGETDQADRRGGGDERRRRPRRKSDSSR